MNRHLYPQIRTVHVLSVIAVFAISAGILLAAQSGCIGATLAGTDGSYDTPDTGLSGHAPVQAVTAWEGMTNLSAACQIADTFADMFFTGVLDATYAVHAVLSLTAVGNIADTVSLKLDGVNDIATFVPQPQYAFAQTSTTDAFVTTWTVSADQSITINFVGDDMNISWGDGTVETGIDRSRTHIYTDAGNYTVSVTGGLTGLTLDRPPDSFGLPGPVPELASIDQWGSISWTNMSNAFAGASNMTYRATDTPNLSLVTDMSFMFESATAFDGDLSSWDVSSVNDTSYMFQSVTAFNQPLNDWDVSSVTTMFRMFSGVTAFNQPLNNWDVSSVTIMSEMFIGATVFNRPLNNWDVSSVTDMKDMFFSATAFNQPLNGWDVSSVITMNQMFLSATAFNQPLNTWDVSSVRYMSYMFNDATAFNQPINTWDVSSVIYMDDMFLGATDFDQDLSNWYVVQDPPVLTANAMFSIRAQNGYLDDLVSTYSIDDARFVMNNKTLSLNSTNLPPAGVYNLDITAPAVLGEPNAGVGGHTRTLIVTVKGEHLPFITTWRTTLPNQNITINFVGSDMDISWGDGMTETNVSGSQTHTYEDAGDYTVSVTGALTGLTLDRPDDFVGRLVPELASIDQWGGISWTNMSNAFAGASNMTYTATDTPNLSLVTDMSFMFESAIAFDGDLSSWDVSSVTDMSSMFAGANTFNQPLNTWDVSSVTEMNGMFSFATSFNQPLNDWDVSSVTYMVGMFFDADSFNQLLNDWDVSSVSTMHNMFFDADSFNQPLNDWDVSSVRIMKSMFQSADSFNQLLNTWDVSKVTNMGGMFFTAHAFNQPLNDWDVSSVMNMGYTFSDASSFNQPLNYWNVSSVIYMEDMFDGATDFNQNLGNWYVVPDSMSIARTAVPGIVGSISAQNTPLNAHTPVYTIVTGGDSARFKIVPDNQLNMISVDTQSAYTVNVTASDGTVFENGNNWRVLDVTVTTADDNTPPTLSLTGNTSVTISVDTPYNDEGATCSDLVDGATIPITPTVVSNTVDTTQIGTYAVTYSCTDAAGNPAADVTRTVIVQTAVTPDTTPPTLSLTGNTSVTISVGTTYNDEGATCSDLVDGATIPITPTVVSNTVDTTQTGTYAVTYSCTDAAGNDATPVARTVIVQTAVTPDTTPPDITLTGSSSVTITVGDSYTDDGATCSDLVDGATIPITPTVVSNTVDTTQTGTYAVTYSCADVAGNAATQVSRTVTVREAGPDTTAPVITILGSNPVTVTVGTTYNDAGADCKDVVDDSPTLSIFGSVDTTVIDTHYIIYFCSDESNNRASAVRTVTVQPDTTPPDITLTGSSSVTITVGDSYTDDGATCSDLVDGATIPITPTVVSNTVDTTQIGTYAVTYSCTDAAGNDATPVARTVTVQPDTTPPTLSLTGSSSVTIIVGASYTDDGATCEDTVDGTIIPTVVSNTVDTAQVGTYAVTYSCTDEANNSATQVSRTVIVQTAVTPDTTPPDITLTGSSSVTITVGDSYTDDGATCSDLVDGATIPITPTVVSNTVDTAQVGTYAVTYSCTDAAGNDATPVARTVTVQPDTTPPTLSLTGSSSVTITVGDSYTDDGATCEDTVDGTIIPTVVSNTVDTAQVGTYAVTYSCTDEANNSATQVSRTVIVQTAVTPDTTPPDITLTGSSSVTITVGDSYTDDGATCSDLVDGATIPITPTVVSNTVDTAQVGTYAVTYSCTDAAGNDATPVARTVTVQPDTTPPTLSLTGSSSVTITVGDSYTDDGATCEDTVDGTIIPTVVSNTVDTTQVGTYAVTYSCTDEANNSATQVSRTVIVQTAVTPDTTPPDITLTGSSSVTITVGDSYTDDGATCSDLVDGATIPITPTVVSNTVDTAQVGTYAVTYSCTDAAGNDATPVARTVIVQTAVTPDTTPPDITLTGSSSVTITVGDSYTDDGATCSDLVDGATIPITPTVVSNTVDTAQVGTYAVTYSCTDAAGNDATPVARTVIVQTAVTPDTTPPDITLTGSSSVTITVGDSYTDDGATCSDLVDGATIPITPTVVSNTVDTAQVGTYAVTYSCTDAAGNDATPVARTVIVQTAVTPDTTPPDITLTGSSSVTITVGDSYTDDGATCSDLVDGATIPITPTVVSNTVDTAQVGTYAVTYSCTDAAGNDATPVARTVIVQTAVTPDTTPPDITLTGSSSVTITVGDSYTDDGATCSDLVDGATIPITPTVVSNTVDTTQIGTYAVTYSCTDAAGNDATPVARTVTVQPDTTPPTLSLTGSSSVTIIVGASYTDDGATCEDTVDGTIIPTVVSNTVDTAQVGTYAVTYSCTDAAGNDATPVARTVIVQTAVTPDTTPPDITLTGSSSVTITVGDSYTDDGATCSDLVDGATIPITPTVVSNTVDTTQIGTYAVTYSCTDAAGNDATPVARTVIVQTAVTPDTTPPDITLTGSSSVTITVGDSYTDDGATCSDLVDGATIPITPTVVSNTVDTTQIGTYAVTYSCTDAAGNDATPVARTVTVQPDTTPPTLSLTGSSSVTIIVGASYTDDGATCEDTVDGTIIPTVVSNTVDTAQVGTYAVTYSCTDAAGNDATPVARTVIVQTAVTPDTTPPDITLTGSSSVTITVGDSYTDDGATCSDLVDGATIPITPTVVSNTVDTTQIGTYAVTYSCTDEANNSATQVSRTVIVQTAVIPDTDRSTKSSRSNNTPNPLTTDNSIIIDGQSYDLGSGTTTTTNPYDITTGQATDLVFTAYSPSDIVRFTIYLNLHGDDIKHSDSDTYIRYDHGVVQIVDPHGFISDASITITEDPEQSRKKIINTLVEFEGNMGLTNMVVYIWNEDRRYTSIRMFNALDITSGTETLPDPEPVESDSGLPADPEPVAPGFEDDAVDPEHTSSDTPWPDDYDDAQVLTLIRMWSGFESEFITDTQLLELLGLEDYQGVDLPDWMMTELGVLVARGDVTVDEFMLALQYVLEHA